MTTMRVQIDGKDCEVVEGTTIFEAAQEAGIEIPRLCHRENLPATSACRLCVVEVDGAKNLSASCSGAVTNDMVISTTSDRVIQSRKLVLELLLSDHPDSCMPEGEDRVCELEEYGRQLGVVDRFQGEKHDYPVEDTNPFFVLDYNACILCARCVTACNDIQMIGAIDLSSRGFDTKVATPFNRSLINSDCTFCGQCLSVCPTGAIRAKSPASNVVKTVSSTCSYCGVGCGINIQVNDQDRIVGIQEDENNQSSTGMLCVKGRFGFNYVHSPERLTTPLIKENGEFRPASWDEALDLVAEKFSEHRGDAIAKLCSAKTTNEDGYIQQKFARLVMQTNNVDHCARLCHAPSVVAMMDALGSGATSNSYSDYEDAGCLMVVGADPNSNHPVAAARMRHAIVNNGAKLIVINPRRIDMCDMADLWLRPLPGTDVALFNSIANVIVAEGLSDSEFVSKRTEGFDQWLSVVDNYPPERAEKITGVPAEDIRKAARMYARPLFSGSCLIWGMGITQHTMGTANAHSLVNMALVAGQMGRPGSGISPLRGQNNVQGCGDAGCLPNSLPGYQMLTDESIAKFQHAWSDHPLPSKPGLALTEMVQAALDGEIKAMYITGENPLLSEPDIQHAEQALRNLDFLVVQDIFLHETAELADVVLPAASFAEKEGTFTNSERRVQRVRKAIEPVGNSRTDWEITCDVARRISSRLGLGLGSEFAFGSASEVWDEMASLMPIIGGISYDRLDAEGGIQWPCPNENHPGTSYLYGEDFPRGPRAKFVGFEQGPAADELPSKRFPLILNTGRILYHWHGGTLTRRDSNLFAHVSELQINMSAADGQRYGIDDGDWIRVRSRRGDLEGRALFTDKMRDGEIFIPFVKLQEHAANYLTNAAFDPSSKIPEFKICAVRIDKLVDGEVDSQGRKRAARV